MKKIFIFLAVTILLIPSIVSAQVSSTVDIQSQASLSINSQILLLIQSLLEQVRALQKQLNDIQNKQTVISIITATTSAKTLNSPPAPTFSPDIQLSKQEILNDGNDHATVSIITKTGDGKVLVGKRLRSVNSMDGKVLLEQTKESGDAGIVTFQTQPTKLYVRCGMPEMLVEIIDTDTNVTIFSRKIKIINSESNLNNLNTPTSGFRFNACP